MAYAVRTAYETSTPDIHPPDALVPLRMRYTKSRLIWIASPERGGAAKGGGSKTVDAVGPKSQNLIDLEKTVLGGYQGNANTAATAGKAFTDAFLDINNSANTTLGHAISLGDSYSRTGAQKVADLLSVAAGLMGTFSLWRRCVASGGN